MHHAAERTAQQADEARPYAGEVRDVGIAIHRQPEVRRSEGSPNLDLTFRGLSDARSSVDRETRLRIVLPAAQAVRLWQLLGEKLGNPTDVVRLAAKAKSNTAKFSARRAGFEVRGITIAPCCSRNRSATWLALLR